MIRTRKEELLFLKKRQQKNFYIPAGGTIAPPAQA